MPAPLQNHPWVFSGVSAEEVGPELGRPGRAYSQVRHARISRHLIGAAALQISVAREVNRFVVGIHDVLRRHAFLIVSGPGEVGELRISVERVAGEDRRDHQEGVVAELSDCRLPRSGAVAAERRRPVCSVPAAALVVLA